MKIAMLPETKHKMRFVFDREHFIFEDDDSQMTVPWADIKGAYCVKHNEPQDCYFSDISGGEKQSEISGIAIETTNGTFICAHSFSEVMTRWLASFFPVELQVIEIDDIKAQASEAGLSFSSSTPWRIGAGSFWFIVIVFTIFSFIGFFTSLGSIQESVQARSWELCTAKVVEIDRWRER